MDGDECAVAKSLAQSLLKQHTVAVRLIQGDVAMHPEVHLDRIDITHTACTQVVHLTHITICLHYLAYLLLNLWRQTFLQQILNRLAEHLRSGYDDEYAHAPPMPNAVAMEERASVR